MSAHVLARQCAVTALICAAAAFTVSRAGAQIEPPAGASPGMAGASQILCSDPPEAVALGSAQWNGWGHGIENTRYQPEPAIRATDVPRLVLKWSFGYAGPGDVFGQPTIVDGRVFAAGPAGQVYSLNAKSGCTYWHYDADGRALSAIAIAELGAPRLVAKPKPKRKRGKHAHIDAHLEVLKAPSAAFFGDDKGNVYALDAEHGTLLWKTQVESHPTARIQAAPVPYQHRLYVAVGSSEPTLARDGGYACCTFRGSVVALDIATGRVAWKTYLVGEEPSAVASATGSQRLGPAGVAVEGSPTLDAARGLLYVATGDSFNPQSAPLADSVVALDLVDGKVRWSKQLQPPADVAPDGVAHEAAHEAAAHEAHEAHEPGGAAQETGGRGFISSPILRTLASGTQILLAGQLSGMVYGLDPERSGEVRWQVKAPETKAAGGVEYGMAADHHSLYVAVSGLATDTSNPTGSLVAIDMKSGAKRWQRSAPAVACSWSSASACPHGEAQAVTVIPGAAFSGSMDGHLRAYSTIDGKILWDYDTAKDFTTVNRVRASGGSLDRGGATIVNGVVYVNSGGDRGSPGNVLLAFSVDGK